MGAAKSYIRLRGSMRPQLDGEREISPADPDEIIDVTLVLRGERELSPGDYSGSKGRPWQRHRLSREALAHVYGSSRADISRVAAFAQDSNLEIKEASPARRSIVLTGSVSRFAAAFKVHLRDCELSGSRYRGRKGLISIPADLDGIVRAVLGLDNRPQTRQRFRYFQSSSKNITPTRTYAPAEVAWCYDFPGGDARDQCIGLIELGGGFDISDIGRCCNANLVPMAMIHAMSIGGADNRFSGDPESPDGGVTLHVALLSSLACGARIVVYFAENTEAGLFNAISAATQDAVHRPSILSIGWGAPELSWTHQAMVEIDRALQRAAAVGVTVCVAAGDDGSSDGVNDGRDHVDFPAASPHVLACGGTSLHAAPGQNIDEFVWNEMASGNGATGGGISSSGIFLPPAWQAHLSVPPTSENVPGRGVPDVAANADPFTAYETWINGKSYQMGGSGVAAALWAGLIARMNQAIGEPLGYVNPLFAIRAHNPQGFRNITQGNNGAYSAGPGWNPCCGLGSPSGRQLLDLCAREVAETGASAPDISLLDAHFRSNSSHVLPDRYANVCLTQGRGHRVMSRSRSLVAGLRYHLQLDIGALSPDSVVENAVAHPFPAGLLPQALEGFWLEVVLAGDDFLLPRNRYDLFLPREGASWVCSCEPGAAHQCKMVERQHYLRMPLTPILRKPSRAACAARPKGESSGLHPATLRLGIYHQKNLVQSQLLTAEVSRKPRVDAQGYRSRIDYTLAPGFRGVDELSPRSLHILTNDNSDGAHRVVINGEREKAIAMTLSEGQLRSAINSVREVLRAIHVSGKPPALTNLFDETNSKPRSDFIDDLRKLAPLGWRLFSTLFQDKPAARRSLRAELRDRSAKIQISRAGGSNFVFPWAFVYDIGLESNFKLHRPCKLLQEWSSASAPFTELTRQCPYHDDHEANTLCPFGFWGFRHDIEQPPSMDTRTLPRRIAVTNSPPQIVAAISLDLDDDLTNAHLREVGDQVRGGTILTRDSLSSIKKALDAPSLEMVYFYCHGTRQPLPGEAGSIPILKVGRDESIAPSDITSWDDFWSGIPMHWETTSPLVFINGCHTAELTPELLVNFVDAFVGVLASGVIGTELLIHQQLANEAALQFLKRFIKGGTVGQALAEMRVHLLRKCNMLGLAYTAYCSSDLVLESGKAG